MYYFDDNFVSYNVVMVTLGARMSHLFYSNQFKQNLDIRHK